MPEDSASQPSVAATAAGTHDDAQRLAVAKGVNDTLNAYITIADGKAVAFLGGATAAASFFLGKMPEGWFLLTCYAISAALYGAGMVAAAMVIFPRVPACVRGVIFWGDIADRATAREYHEDFERECRSGGLLDDYSVLNWCTSRILRRKFRRLRLCMLLCFAALAVSLPAFIATRQG